MKVQVQGAYITTWGEAKDGRKMLPVLKKKSSLVLAVKIYIYMYIVVPCTVYYTCSIKSTREGSTQSYLEWGTGFENNIIIETLKNSTVL